MQEDSNYCVYIHRNKRTNEIFYVGSGRDRRAPEKRGRCHGWYVIADKDGFNTEVIHSGLTKHQSLEKELECYNYYSTFSMLVNVLKPALPLAYTIEMFQDDLQYCESSVTFLRWKTPGSNKANKRIIGQPAGGTASGYGSLRLSGKYYAIHRIVWTLHYGDISPGFVVDHIDGEPLNNNISNLRLILQSQNSRNTRKLKNNSSGIVGVSLRTNKKRKSHRWCSYFVDMNGVETMKYFSILQFGNDEAFRLACEWRAEQIRLLNEQGAGYTERHGT